MNKTVIICLHDTMVATPLVFADIVVNILPSLCASNILFRLSEEHNVINCLLEKKLHFEIHSRFKRLQDKLLFFL